MSNFFLCAIFGFIQSAHNPIRAGRACPILSVYFTCAHFMTFRDFVDINLDYDKETLNSLSH